MQKLIVAVMCMLAWLIPQARTYSVSSLQYSVKEDNPSEVELVKWSLCQREKSSPDDCVVIVPSQVEIEGVTYDVTSIRASVFYGDDDLQEVYLPNSVTKLGDGNFAYCKSLRKVVLSENIKSLHFGNFDNLPMLRNIELPKGLSSISGAFKAVGIESLELPDGVSTLWGCLLNCENLERLSLNSITDMDFCRPASVKELVFTDGAVLHEGVLKGFDSLEKVVLPENYSANGDILVGSSHLKEIVCSGAVPPAGKSPLSWAAYQFGKQIIVWVPEGATNAYESDEIWSRFTIKEMNESGLCDVAVDIDNQIEVWTLDGVFRGRFGSLNEVRGKLNGGAYLIRENGKGRIVKI